MRIKKDIIRIALVLAALLLDLSLTQAGWVVCDDKLPDEYMDFGFVTEINGDQRTSKAFPPLRGDSLWFWHVEYTYVKDLPAFFTWVSLRIKPLLTITLRI